MLKRLPITAGGVKENADWLVKIREDPSMRVYVYFAPAINVEVNAAMHVEQPVSDS